MRIDSLGGGLCWPESQLWDGLIWEQPAYTAADIYHPSESRPESLAGWNLQSCMAPAIRLSLMCESKSPFSILLSVYFCMLSACKTRNERRGTPFHSLGQGYLMI